MTDGPAHAARLSKGPQAFSSDYADAPAYWQIGILWNVLISAEQTFGQFTLIDQTMPREAGPPPHLHERMSEGFYILEGAVRYTVGDDDRQLTAHAASAVWIPPGTRHSFTVVSETARALNYYTPGGFDDRFRYLATPATERILPPAGLTDDVDPETQQRYLTRLRDLHQETFLDPETAVW